MSLTLKNEPKNLGVFQQICSAHLVIALIPVAFCFNSKSFASNYNAALWAQYSSNPLDRDPDYLEALKILPRLPISESEDESTSRYFSGRDEIAKYTQKRYDDMQEAKGKFFQLMQKLRKKNETSKGLFSEHIAALESNMSVADFREIKQKREKDFQKKLQKDQVEAQRKAADAFSRLPVTEQLRAYRIELRNKLRQQTSYEIALGYSVSAIEVSPLPQGVKFTAASGLDFVKNRLPLWLGVSDESIISNKQGVIFNSVIAPRHGLITEVVETRDGQKVITEVAPFFRDMNYFSYLFADLYFQVSQNSFKKFPNHFSSLQNEKAAYFHTFVVPILYGLGSNESSRFRITFDEATSKAAIDRSHVENAELTFASDLQLKFGKSLFDKFTDQQTEMIKEQQRRFFQNKDAEVLKKMAEYPMEVGLILVSLDAERDSFTIEDQLKNQINEAKNKLGFETIKFLQDFGYDIFKVTYKNKEMYPLSWFPDGFDQGADRSSQKLNRNHDGQKWLFGLISLTNKMAPLTQKTEYFKKLTELSREYFGLPSAAGSCKRLF